MSKLVSLNVRPDGIAEVTMEDVARKNIFSEELIDGLVQAIDELEATHKPPVMILKGLTDVFSGGGEKQTLLDLSEGKLAVKDLLVSERLVNTSFPVIAAMEGHAVGGGLIMAACCDIVLAAKESRYGAVFMNMGFTPGMGCTTLLQEMFGPFIASEMMYTGKRFKGRELVEKHTNINYVLPKSEILPKALDIALQIAEKNVKSVYLLKFALSARKKKLLIDARLQEDYMHQISFAFPETKETIKNFYVD